jgi:hypothetical protein
MPDRDINRIVPCPDCHRLCDFCSWYAKNARNAGCGTTLKRSKRCEWDALKGTTCPLCGGTTQMRLVGHLEPLVPQTKC